jgi:hypothetical protein
MTGPFRRLAVPLVLGLLLSTAFSGWASATYPWVSGCSGYAGSNYLCIYRDRDLQGAYGHMAGSNASYVGEDYPSSTYDVDNSVSSAMNLYGSKDVIWHHNINNQGTAYCLDSNVAALWVGLFDNDVFSSHAVAVDDSAC